MLRPIAVRGALLTLLALSVAAPGTAGAAGWIAPVHVGGTTGNAPSPAVDAGGNALVAWQAGAPGVIRAARHVVGTPGFTAFPNISTDSVNDNTDPVVVMSRSGDALVAWIHTTGAMNDKEIDILPVRPDGTTGTLTAVSAAGTSASNVTAAINASGDAVVAWEEGGKVVAVTRQGATGTFTNTSTPTVIDGLGSGPVAAIDGAGNAIVVMQHNGVFQEISESHHPRGGSWSLAATLTPSGGHSFSSPDVASNDAGAIVATFLDNGIVSVVTGSASLGWGNAPAVQPLSTDTASHGPFVTVATSGAAIVGWTTSSAVQTSSRAAGGSFPAAGSVSSIPTDIPDDFALGGSGRGDAIVSWSTFDTQLMTNIVRAAVRPAGASGGFGAPTIVSNTTGYGSKPQVALDEQGDGVLAYPVGATPAGIDIAVYDASAPQVGALSGPSRVVVGTVATFSTSVTDAFSPVIATWSFGDGSAAASGSSVSHTFTKAGRFTVALTASDSTGNTTAKSLTLTVDAEPLPPRCVVPKLKGKSLSQAKRALAGAHCRLGTVHKPRARKHHRFPKLIVTQTSPRAGASRPNGTKVALTLGPAPTPHKKKKK